MEPHLTRYAPSNAAVTALWNSKKSTAPQNNWKGGHDSTVNTRQPSTTWTPLDPRLTAPSLTREQVLGRVAVVHRGADAEKQQRIVAQVLNLRNLRGQEQVARDAATAVGSRPLQFSLPSHAPRKRLAPTQPKGERRNKRGGVQRTGCGASEEEDKRQIERSRRGKIVAGIWNAQGLGKNYMEYADDQGYDILLFAETKGKANRLEGVMERELGQHRLLASKQANGKAAPDPKDSGGECAIYLGKRMAKHYLQHGSPCPRLVWVQLRVSQIPIFVCISGYAPHRGLDYYDQTQFWTDVMALKESFPPGTRFLMGLDANASLRRNIPGITGRWCVRDYAMDKLGDQFTKTLRTLGWEALSTNTMYAAPRKEGGVAKFVGTFMNSNPRGNRVRKQLTY